MSFLRRAATGLLTAFVLLGAAELGLRALRGAPVPAELPDDFEYAYLDVRKPFFRETRDERGNAAFVSARPRSHRESFVMPKPPGTARVFVVGGSVALPFSGDGLLDDSFSRLLPGSRVEAIGCGMGGYDSARELGVLREVLRYQPDLVVVMSGNNEFFGAPVAHPRLVRLASRASHLALYRAFAGPPRPLENPTPDERERVFEANLREMARLAGRAGVPIAFCVLPANLRDSVPSSTVSLPWDEPGFFAAWTAWEEGDAARAARLFAVRVASAPEDAHAHYWLARSLERTGRSREAALHYARAADLDRPGERTSARRALSVRRATAESGALLVDLAAAFAAHSTEKTTGGTLMRDACHWRRAYDSWAADLIVTSVARAPRAPAVFARPSAAASSPSRRGPSFEREWRDLLYSGLVKACCARPELFYEEAVNLLQHARREDPVRFARASSAPVALAAELSMDYPQEACARRQEPLWSHIAESLRRDGRAREAEQAAARALSASPDSYRAQFVAALSAGRAGRASEAAGRLEALSRRADGRAARLWANYWRAKALTARKPRDAR